jgi:hypothetical protein
MHSQLADAAGTSGQVEVAAMHNHVDRGSLEGANTMPNPTLNDCLATDGLLHAVAAAMLALPMA